MLATAAGPAAAQDEPQLDFTAPNVGQSIRDLITFLDQSVVNPEQLDRRADQFMRELAEFVGTAPAAGGGLAPATSGWSMAAGPVVLAQVPSLPNLAPGLTSAVEQVRAQISDALSVAAGHGEDGCPDEEKPHHNPLSALSTLNPTELVGTLLGGLPTDVDADGLPNVRDLDIDADGLVNSEDSDLDGDSVLDLVEVDRNNPVPATFSANEHEDCPPPDGNGDDHDDDDNGNANGHDKDHDKDGKDKDKDKDKKGKGKKDKDDDKDKKEAAPVGNTLPRTGGGAGAMSLLFLGAGAGMTAWLRSRSRH